MPKFNFPCLFYPELIPHMAKIEKSIFWAQKVHLKNGPKKGFELNFQLFSCPIHFQQSFLGKVKNFQVWLPWNFFEKSHDQKTGGPYETCEVFWLHFCFSGLQGHKKHLFIHIINIGGGGMPHGDPPSKGCHFFVCIFIFNGARSLNVY